MIKEDLFKLVRSEKVVLWAGAGFSMYAGFPSGSHLSKIIYKSLSKDEKLVIPKGLALDALTEEFVRLKGDKVELLAIINKVFSKKPDVNKFHKLIFDIPHFKKIITTNYDTLFEDSYGNKISVITKDSDIAYIDDNKPMIFKIHGDIKNPDDIIITREDYSKFYQKDLSSPFWSKIISEISSKTILFLGYGYEDSNIWAVFEKVSAYLKEHKKKAFLVVPKMVPHKVNYLLTKNIVVIQETAEIFLRDLYQNIKDNIWRDFEHQLVSVDTFTQFFNNNNLLPEFKGEKGRVSISKVRGSNSKVIGSLNLQFKKDEQYMKSFYDHLNGNSDQFEVVPENLENLDIRFEGLKMPLDMGNLHSLLLKRSPSEILEVDITFPSKDFELTGLKVEIFAYRGSVKNIVNLHNAKYIVLINTSNQPNYKIDIKFERPDVFLNVKSALQIFKCYVYLIGAVPFQLYFHKTQFLLNNSLPFKNVKKIVEELNLYINYFEKLKLVEHHMNVRFTDIFNIDEESENILDEVLFFINNKKRRNKLEGEMTANISSYEETKDWLKVLAHGNQYTLTFVQNDVTKVILHGIELILGFKKMDIFGPEILNMSDLEKGNTLTARMISKDGDYYYSYLAEQPSMDEMSI